MGSRKLRLAVVTPIFPNSAEKYRGNYNYSIAKSIQRHADVQVFCPLSRVPDWNLLKPRSMRYNPIDPNFQPGGIPVTYLPYKSFPVLSRPINGVVSDRTVRPLLEAYRPDVILAYWIYPEGYGALRVARSMGVPLIMGCLGSDLRRISDPISNYLIKATLKRASAVITVSEEMREQTIQYGVAAEKVHAIVNGCDLSVFRPGNQAEARGRLGVSPDEELITFVGWLSRTKGLDELLDSIVSLTAKHPALSIACIGEGPLAGRIRELEAASGNRGHFRLLGAQTSGQISQWITASNALALPSYSEGCPNVVLEALACGRPVIASNVGGIPEIVTEDCGALVPPRDVPALCAGIERVLGRRWDFDEIARKQSRSWDAVADETFEVCQSVLRPRHSAAGWITTPDASSEVPSNERVAVARVNTGKDDRMRITVVTPIFPTNAEPYRGWPVFKTVESLRELARVEIICPVCQFPKTKWLQPRSMRYNEIDTSYQPLGFDVKYIPYQSIPVLGRPLNGWRAGRKMFDAVKASRPDLILAYWIYPEGYGAWRCARRLGVRFVVGSRGSDLQLRDPLSRRMSVRALREADHVLTVSDELRRRAIAAGTPSGRVSTIVNGIDDRILNVRNRQEARRTLKVAPDAKVILFIGWLNVTKGLDVLLSATQDMAMRQRLVNLVAIGEGPLDGNLLLANAQGPMAGRVRMTGPCNRQEIATWLAACDLLCLPSVAEGCPNVVLEALACGRPVVASNVGGIPEILTEETGILIEDRSVPTIARALESALFERRWNEEKIAARWRRSWMDVAAETYDICRTVASRDKVRERVAVAE